MSPSGTRNCSRCGEPGHDIRTCSIAPGHPVGLAIDLSAGYGQWQPFCTACGWEGSWETDRSSAQSEARAHHSSTRG